MDNILSGNEMDLVIGIISFSISIMWSCGLFMIIISFLSGIRYKDFDNFKLSAKLFFFTSSIFVTLYILSLKNSFYNKFSQNYTSGMIFGLSLVVFLSVLEFFRHIKEE